MSTRAPANTQSVSAAELDRLAQDVVHLNLACSSGQVQLQPAQVFGHLQAAAPAHLALLSAVPSLAAAAPAVVRPAPGGAVMPAAAQAAGLQAMLPALNRLNDVAAIQNAALAVVAGSTLVAAPAALAQPAQALATARTPQAARVAAGDLFAAAAISNQQVLFEGVAAAVCAAATDIGFAKVELVRPEAGRLQIFAADADGAGVVTEVRNVPGAGPQLETEIVGLQEPRCAKAYADFRTALRARGVESSAEPPKSTGGMPTSRAAIAVAARQLRRERARRQPRVAPDTSEQQRAQAPDRISQGG